MIPDNGSIKMLAFGLAMAHFIYGDTKASVLFIVQPGEKNVRTSHPNYDFWGNKNENLTIFFLNF